MSKKSMGKSELFSSLLYIVIGALLTFFPEKALSWAMTICGVVFVVSGVLEILKKNVGGGAISLIIGIAILVLGWLVTGIVLIVLGVLIAVKGVVALLDVLKKKRSSILEVLYPVITIVVGVVIAFGNGLHIVLVIGGILLLVNGIIGLLGELKK